jgi:multidrug resistance efflux pump
MTTSTTPTPPGSPGRPELRERVQGLKLPKPEERPPSGKAGWFFAFLGVALASWFFALWWTRSSDLLFQSFEQPVEATSTTPKTTPAGAASPAKSSGTTAAATDAIALESKGYIIPAHQILVSPKVSGMITRLCLEEGLRVDKGSILAEIETIQYQADLDQARANRDLLKQRLLELEHGNRPQEILQADAELAEARATLAELEDQYQRQVTLRKSGASTEQSFVSAERKAEAQEQRVGQLEQAMKLMKEGPRVERIEAARAEVRQAEAQLTRSQWQLDNCTIKAPISGTILKKNAEEGNIVNPVAFNGSYSLCDMADLADLEVSLDIQERDIGKVFPQQKCQIRAEAFPERPYPGVVDRLMPIADRAKGAIPVRVKVRVPKDEEGVYLKPEMGALVTFYGTAPKPEAVKQPEPEEADKPAKDAPTAKEPPAETPAASSSTP